VPAGGMSGGGGGGLGGLFEVDGAAGRWVEWESVVSDEGSTPAVPGTDGNGPT
jgi:hypothetical protein